MPTKEELKQLQALPLDLKIARTQQRIREWVHHYGADGVYVSFSGGKDSTVLLHIVREMYPEIEAVFVNTGLEYPEIKAFVKKVYPNVREDISECSHHLSQKNVQGCPYKLWISHH